MHKLRETTEYTLTQLMDLARNLSDEEFCSELPLLMNNSIGKHYRHIIEFYMVLVNGLNTGLINYDNRKHDPDLEQDRLRCIEILESICSELPAHLSGKPLELRVCYSNDTDTYTSIHTNEERELVYNIEHAIHHMAIIRIALHHSFSHIEISQNFGYAYSTLKHLKR